MSACSGTPGAHITCGFPAVLSRNGRDLCDFCAAAYSEQIHDSEMADRARVEAHLTDTRVRDILRVHSHMLTNKSAKEIRLLRLVLLSVYQAGANGELP